MRKSILLLTIAAVVVIAAMLVPAVNGDSDYIENYSEVEKRFIFDGFLNKTGELWKKVGDVFTKKIKSLHDAFKKLQPNGDFSATVKALIPSLKKGMSKAACKAVCVTGIVLKKGPLALLKENDCGIICEAALHKLALFGR